MSNDNAPAAPQAPAAANLRRIGAMETLPVFLKLQGRRVVLAGGQSAAAWKVEVLAASGAEVNIYAPEVSAEVEELVQGNPSGPITMYRRAWTPSDLRGAALAVCVADTPEEGAAFFDAARAVGVPVNVVDRPEFCDFQFGAIVNRSPLLIGISTGGAAPVLAQTVRSTIEGLLPGSIANWLSAAKTWRGLGGRLGSTMTERRKFWDRFSAMAMAHGDRAPTSEDLDDLLAGPTASDLKEPPVTIIVWKGGPAGGLTLEAIRALRMADHIYCDDAVPDALSDFARREAGRSKLGACNDCWIAEVAHLIAKHLRVVVLSDEGEAGSPLAMLSSAGLKVVILEAGSKNRAVISAP